jgi:GNAT superfamily N-acetyltransferase
MWEIAALTDVDEAAVLPQIEAIFFDSAATQSFASEAERTTYCDLWLGRYVWHCPEAFLIARGPSGEVAGYLAGALFSNKEPLPGPDYYDGFPAGLIAAYPAHLHVNVRHDHRGRNVGSTLIDAFRAICRAHDVGGLHAVTAAGSRAAAFFMRCGLEERATADWRRHRLAYLAGLLG